MHYKLSTYVSKKNNRCAYVLEAGGIEVGGCVFKTSGDTTNDILECIIKGFRLCKQNLHHSDILCICLQSSKIYELLSASEEDKNYLAKFDELYNTLDTLDCRYKYVLDKSSYAKIYLEGHEVEKIIGSGIQDAFADFE